MISSKPQAIEDLHHIDLWGRMDEHWPILHEEYINISNNKYEFLPIYEAIIAPELACNPEYMPWFKVRGKPYLLAEVARGRQLHTRRPRQAPRHPRFGTTAEAGFIFGPASSAYYTSMPLTF
ncbi:hypothetical protein Gotur_024797 [Gossypium turneri]